MGLIIFATFAVFVIWLLSLAFFAGRGLWDFVFFVWMGLPVAGSILLGHVRLDGVDLDAVLSWGNVLLYGAGAALTGWAVGAIWRSLCQDETYPSPVDD